MDVLLAPTADLLSTRLLLLHDLANSLEISQTALTRNDAEMIARGAARQAELCRQWSLLEDQLHRESQHRLIRSNDAAEPSPQIAEEFAVLRDRIRHLTRVHCSLLRHLQRSLAILHHLAASGTSTYCPDPTLLTIDVPPRAGDLSCQD